MYIIYFDGWNNIYKLIVRQSNFSLVILVNHRRFKIGFVAGNYPVRAKFNRKKRQQLMTVDF